MSNTGKCKTCDADVVFITDQAGKRQILNKTRVRMYALADGDRPDRYLQVLDAPYLAYISHFLTCPQAASHTKTKR